jgi:hypothetical protein
MDPFLEHPDIFPGLHDGMIAYLSEFLQIRLPAPYYATFGRRAWIEVSEPYVGPDVEVRQRGHEHAAENSGGLIVVDRFLAAPVVIHVPHDERTETIVEIYMRRGSDRRLVTSMEVLSLANKSRGEHGRDLYLRKQREILASQVHLVEIDLLRSGEHTTAVPHDRLMRKVDRFDYHVCIHRFDHFEDYFVYPIQMNERLPDIAIPLLPPDEPVKIDLQSVFDRTYDAGPYRREIDYSHDAPEPPIPEGWASWANDILSDQQRRN